MIDEVSQLVNDGNPAGALDAAIQALAQLRSNANAEAWSRFCESVADHPLFELFSQCPATKRAFDKPRGYAGDAALMDLLYGFVRAPAATTAVGRGIHARLCERASPSLFGRVRAIEAVLDGLADGASVLSVASGHAREITTHNERLNITAFDQDEASLSVLSQALPFVRCVAGNVRALIAGDAIEGRYDFIYASGLYDYLDASAAERLTEVLANALAPGGRLLVGNFTHVGDEVAYMESFMGWPLLRRSAADLAKLAPKDLPSSVALGPEGYVAYLTVHRPGPVSRNRAGTAIGARSGEEH